MILGIFRYESRAGAGPMHTSSSAKRTCSDSRSASEYTATVCTPSSRHARMTRSAISPRLEMRTLLNMTARQYERRLRIRIAFEARPGRVARTSDALDPKRELRRTGRVEHGALVRDHSARVELHQRLVEALHAVLHRALFDQIRNVEGLFHVANVVAHRRGVDQDFRGGDSARAVRPR